MVKGYQFIFQPWQQCIGGSLGWWGLLYNGLFCSAYRLMWLNSWFFSPFCFLVYFLSILILRIFLSRIVYSSTEFQPTAMMGLEIIMKCEIVEFVFILFTFVIFCKMVWMLDIFIRVFYHLGLIMRLIPYKVYLSCLFLRMRYWRNINPHTPGYCRIDFIIGLSRDYGWNLGCISWEIHLIYHLLLCLNYDCKQENVVILFNLIVDLSSYNFFSFYQAMCLRLTINCLRILPKESCN